MHLYFFADQKWVISKQHHRNKSFQAVITHTTVHIQLHSHRFLSSKLPNAHIHVFLPPDLYLRSSSKLSAFSRYSRNGSCEGINFVAEDTNAKPADGQRVPHIFKRSAPEVICFRGWPLSFRSLFESGQTLIKLYVLCVQFQNMSSNQTLGGWSNPAKRFCI